MKNSILGSAKTNPATWWLVGLSFAITASLTSSPIFLVALGVTSMVCVGLFRENSPWAKSIRFYLQLAIAVILIRVLFRVIFNLEVAPQNPLITLPGFEINLGVGSALQIMGPISAASFFAALVDGLRLAAIILAIGMANSLANPRKLLKATPGALYEIATAISISINLAPQLIASLNRVRRASKLRGQSKGLKALPGIVIPVLEDTIDQSMALAASMAARGFGRRASSSKTRIRLIRAIGLTAVTVLTSGIFLLLISPKSQQLDLAIIAVGFLLTLLYIKMSALGSNRTRFRKIPWRVGDYILLVASAVLLTLAFSGVLAK